MLEELPGNKVNSKKYTMCVADNHVDQARTPSFMLFEELQKVVVGRHNVLSVCKHIGPSKFVQMEAVLMIFSVLLLEDIPGPA